MRQLKLVDLALPEIWVVGSNPKVEGRYECRVKMDSGEYEFMSLDYKDNAFVFTGGKVISWR